MRNALAIVVLVAVVPFASSAQARMSGLDAAAAKEVRRLNDDEVDAFLKNDKATLAQLFSDDFVVTNPLNQFIHKNQVLDMVQSGLLGFKSYERRIEYLRVEGKTAIVAGSEAVVFSGRMPLAGKPVNLRFTAVWMKQSGRWREVARHANVVPPATSARASPPSDR